MKSHRAHRSVRAVSLSLSLVLLCPYLSVAAAAAASAEGPNAAGAATGAPAESEKTVCVLDFADLSRSQGAGLGKVAAERFSKELSGMQRWTVVPDAAVRERAAKLALAMPMDRAARERFASGSSSEQIVYGTVTTARIQEKPQRQAYVRMMVLVEDAKSGELVQGAISEGTSGTTHAATASRDELLGEAVSNAASSYARFLAEPKTPAAAPVQNGPADRSVQEDRAAPQHDRVATSTQIVTDKEARQLFASVSSPDPVVIDIPKTGLEGNGLARRPLVTTRALRLLVGGLLLAGLLYLGGGGGIGSTRPF